MNFLEQQFVLYHDTKGVIFIDNIMEYIYQNYGEIYRFLARMKYHTVLDADKERAYHKSNVYRNYLGTYTDCKYGGDFTKDFYLYTSNNVMISPLHFYDEYYKVRPQYRSKYRRRKSHSYTKYKQPKTTAENRQNCLVLKSEGEPEVRGKRRKLPTWWDDQIVRRSCSWKDSTKRKRQYK